MGSLWMLREVERLCYQIFFSCIHVGVGWGERVGGWIEVVGMGV